MTGLGGGDKGGMREWDPSNLRARDLTNAPTPSGGEAALWASSGFPSSLHLPAPAFPTLRSQPVPGARAGASTPRLALRETC